MSNHFHLVVYYDPLASGRWSDEEVADRWLTVSPPHNGHGKRQPERIPACREAILKNPKRLAHCRRELGSISTFMKFLKQPIATRANKEDDRSRHFFEKRFYSGALLDQESVLASMAYVDLNPIRAKIATTLENSSHTSIQERLAKSVNTKERLEEALEPLVSGLETVAPRLGITLQEYVDRLKAAAPVFNTPSADSARTWLSNISLVKKYQRVYGNKQALADWLLSRDMRCLELATEP